MKSRAEKATISATIDEQSLAASKAYPDIKILCLRCNTSVMGADYASHLHDHLVASVSVPKGKTLKNWRLSFGPQHGRFDEKLFFDIMNGGYVFQTVDSIEISSSARWSIRRLRVGTTDIYIGGVTGNVHDAGEFVFPIKPFVIDPVLRVEMIIETFDEGDVYGSLTGEVFAADTVEDCVAFRGITK